MLKSAAFFFVGVILKCANAGITHAALPPLHPDLCPKGADSGPPPSRITISKATKEESETILNRINTCPSACYDLTVTLTVDADTRLVTWVQPRDHKIYVDTVAKDMCKPPTEENLSKVNRGCGPEEGQPRITIVMKKSDEAGIEGRTIGPKSRCDKDISRLINSVFEKEEFKTDDLEEALNQLSELPETVPPVGTISGNQVLVDALTPHMSKENAERIVREQPDLAAQLSSYIESGNEEKVREIATELKLNPDVLGDIAKQKAIVIAAQDDVTSEPVGISGSEVTGFKPTPGALGGTWEIDPYGQPSAPTSRKVVNNQLQETIDPGALGAIAADAQSRVCAAVQGTCYVSTEAQFGTMMIETNGDVRVLGDNSYSASLAQANAAQSNFGNYLSQYEAVFGEDYLLHTIDIGNPELNPEWIASQSTRMQAIILQDKGINAGGNYTQLVSAYNGSGPAAAAYGARAINNTQLLQSGNATSYWQTAYNSAIEGGGPSITNLAANIPTFSRTSVSSPFANVSPFGVQYQYPNVIAPVGVSGGGVTSLGGSPNSWISSLINSLFSGGSGGQSGQQQPQEPQGPVLSPIHAVAAIIAQPSEIARGKSLIVSWSSVGMSPSEPCQVVLSMGTTTSLIGQGNEGSENIRTSISSKVGTWEFELQCRALSDGRPVEERDSVSIK